MKGLISFLFFIDFVFTFVGIYLQGRTFGAIVRYCKENDLELYGRRGKDVVYLAGDTFFFREVASGAYKEKVSDEHLLGLLFDYKRRMTLTAFCLMTLVLLALTAKMLGYWIPVRTTA